MNGPYAHTFRGCRSCGACEEMVAAGHPARFMIVQHRVQLWQALADKQARAGYALVNHCVNPTLFELSDAIAVAKVAARARRRASEAARFG